MFVQDPQTPDGEATADHLTGSEDEAAAAFEARENQSVDEADTQQDPKPADEPADDADTEAEEAAPEEATEAEELAEVEIGGKTYKVPPEVEKAVLRQADYSRKMNEVGAKEKEYTQRLEVVQGLEEAAEKRAEALAEVRALDARIKQYEGVDWAKAREENPAEAAVAAVELLTLQNQRKEAAQNAANVQREFTVGKNKLMETARNEMDAALRKDLKGWGDEMGQRITRYALDNKVQLQTLQTLTDPAVVIALEKARKYDELQASKTQLKTKVQDAPAVSKPGAPRRPDPKADAMARLRKDNSQEAAEAVFLQRMR